MDNFQIETAQNVSIQQNIAGIGERILAYLIDLMILIVYVFIMAFVVGVLSDAVTNQWVLSLLFGLPFFLYFLLWETFWDGKTPGKAAMKIKVAKLDGSRPKFSDYLIRWLLRLVDISISSGGVAICVILLRGKGQRLGDMAANTTVIDEKKRVSFKDTILVEVADDYLPVYPQVTVFDDAQIRKIKAVYTAAKRDGKHNVILQLSEKVSSLMEVSPEEKPLQFIDRVLSDYNYYTQQL
ncbi:RDD family protein [Aquimarina hainanensis]|uniref:RDD family protein n=1 Tax=Aquimarina hainanensis TaxID=1578017 RepID=A0ABW5N4M5_9FLAO|nr:RDD family protein [Aquimarina sp. TRL1]QKX06059.1 RDD family protein [Aquimarina sp. TRL1]